MNKNIIYTFARERKRTTHSHEITSTIETFIQMYNKRITHVHLITFLKEKHYLDTC
jgi:predicted component of type VI protein secretion system